MIDAHQYFCTWQVDIDLGKDHHLRSIVFDRI